MRNITRLAALLTMMLFALLATGAPAAVAQDEATPPESGSKSNVFDDLGQLEGLHTVIARDFSVDYEAIYSSMATPEVDEEFIDPELPQGLQYMGAAIFHFENDDNASNAYDLLTEDLTEQSAANGIDYEEIEVEDFGDNTIALKAEEGDETYGTTTLVVIITQQDEYLYLGTGTALEDDPTDSVTELVSHVKDADAGDGDGEFHADGTSQGGLWDKFPTVDDDLIPEGLIVTDSQLYPETTPESGS